MGNITYTQPWDAHAQKYSLLRDYGSVWEAHPLLLLLLRVNHGGAKLVLLAQRLLLLLLRVGD